MPLRSIIFIMALLALVSAAAGGYLYYDAMLDSVHRQGEVKHRQVLENARDRMTAFLEANLNSVKTLAGLAALKQALQKPSGTALTDANVLLDHFNATLGTSVCYLMNQQGLTIAASNREAPDSFVGKSYGFRPYFKNALKGQPVAYMALGVTSGLRGAYYSHPVYVDGQAAPAGVAVIKSAIDKLEAELADLVDRSPQERILMVSPQGVIFLSTYTPWRNHLLWDPPAEKLEALAKTRQFGLGPWQWTRLVQQDAQTAVDSSGVAYRLYQSRIPAFPDWRIVYLAAANTSAISVSSSLIQTHVLFIAGLWILICALVIVLYHMGAQDLHRRKLAGKALKESEERYRKLSEATLEGVLLMDNGNILAANQVLANMLGQDLDQLVGSLALDYVAPESRELVSRHIRQGFEEPYEFFCLKKDGSRFPVEACGKLVHYQGRLVRQTALRDLTDRKLAEKEYAKRERLQGVLEMAGAVCHEINQPLMTISGYAELMAFSLEKTDPNKARSEKIVEQVARLGQITKNLMQITRYKTKAYIQNGSIIDIEKSAGKDTAEFKAPK